MNLYTVRFCGCLVDFELPASFFIAVTGFGVYEDFVHCR